MLCYNITIFTESDQGHNHANLLKSGGHMGWELQTSFILGVLHSLEPGHGKTAMLAMMLDPKKTWFDSFALAVSAVFSHSALILAVAGLTHFGGHMIFGEKVDHFLWDNLRVFGPLSLIAIGLFLISSSKKAHSHCCKSKSHNHGSSPKIPILLGVSIGLYPCPTLIATFIASISTGQLNLGISAVCLFALGSFLSILSSAFLLKWFGTKFAARYASRFSQFNWKGLQGVMVLIVGIIALFERDHH